MANLVRCPECGGIVGATQTTDEGAPCTCFEYERAMADNNPSSGTDVMPAETTTTVTKYCRICGKDLTGKKRLKDSLGYWCPECAEEDRARKEDKGTPCEQCHRKVPPDTLTSVDGKMMCSRCVREQRELRAPGSKRFRSVSHAAYKEHEKRNMLIMAGIAVILLILMVIAWQRFPGLH
jgi:hypothetical protein